MVALLPTPELTFVDADGAPYAAGTLTTYVPSSTTSKDTWSESTGTALNTNPITLDSAGRCIVYGDGAYRLILKDSAGNTIFDQESNTLVSVAMAPVCIAATIADAQALLGITDSAAALAALTAADAAEAAARAAAITAEATARAAADATLTTNLAAEVTRATAAEAALAATGAFTGFTWHDLTGSRAAATNYTNSHGKLIVVNVVATSAAGGTVQGYVDGVAVSQWLSGNGNWAHTCTLLVPSGSVYRAQVTGGATFPMWAEFY
jgi:hypothetical protein